MGWAGVGEEAGLTVRSPDRCSRSWSRLRRRQKLWLTRWTSQNGRKWHSFEGEGPGVTHRGTRNRGAAGSLSPVSSAYSLYKKAGLGKEKRQVTYVVAKKGVGRKVRRPAGVRGHFKVVDSRMKKDQRAQQRKEQKKKHKRK